MKRFFFYYYHQMSLATFCHGKTATSQKFKQFTRSLVKYSFVKVFTYSSRDSICSSASKLKS